MALTPEYLQGLPEELENLTMQFEADIIADISRRIVKAGKCGSRGTLSDTAEYQLLLLKQLGASSDHLEKLIAQYTKQSERIVRDMVFDAAQTDSEFYENFYARTHRDYVPFEYNDYLQQLADAAVNQTLGELNNFTRSMGFSIRGTDGRIYFKQAADVYRSAMDKAHFYAALGGMDYLSAVRMAAKEITAAGLQFVDYASGVRNHADVAARRALLTGVSQMTGKISERNAEELETDVVEVTAHAGARPDHAEWQGQWYSLTGRDKRYPLLAEVTGYGRVDGLKGANCRHDFYPVIPGISERAYTDEQLRNIDPPPVTIDGKTYTYYEAQQKQRAYERAIRKTKREIIAADASGDKDMFTAKSVLLRRQKDAYGKFSKDAGLLPRIERTGVAEYGQSISAKAVWADRKAGALKNSAVTLTSGGGSGTIKVSKGADSVQSYSRNDLLQMIEKSKSLDKPIFADDTAGNRFASNARNIKPEPGFYDVALHGESTFAEFFGKPINASDLAKIIKSRDDYKVGTPIRLLSCNTGNTTETGNCFAQLLANKMNTNVKAPTDIIWVREDGSFSIGSDEFSNDGELKTFWARE